MALHGFEFVFLLVFCLLLCLALLWGLDWLYLRPSRSQEGAKRSRLPRSLCRAAQTIAPPVVWPPQPRRLESRRMLLCGPGVRSKAAEEHPRGYPPRASLVPTRSAPTSASPMLTSTHLSGMAGMARPRRSRPFAVRPAAPPSLPGATRPAIV